MNKNLLKRYIREILSEAGPWPKDQWQSKGKSDYEWMNQRRLRGKLWMPSYEELSKMIGNITLVKLFETQENNILYSTEAPRGYQHLHQAVGTLVGESTKFTTDPVTGKTVASTFNVPGRSPTPTEPQVSDSGDSGKPEKLRGSVNITSERQKIIDFGSTRTTKKYALGIVAYACYNKALKGELINIADYMNSSLAEFLMACGINIGYTSSFSAENSEISYLMLRFMRDHMRVSTAGSPWNLQDYVMIPEYKEEYVPDSDENKKLRGREVKANWALRDSIRHILSKDAYIDETIYDQYDKYVTSKMTSEEDDEGNEKLVPQSDLLRKVEESIDSLSLSVSNSFLRKNSSMNVKIPGSDGIVSGTPESNFIIDALMCSLSNDTKPSDVSEVYPDTSRLSDFFSKLYNIRAEDGQLFSKGSVISLGEYGDLLCSYLTKSYSSIPCNEEFLVDDSVPLADDSLTPSSGLSRQPQRTRSKASIADSLYREIEDLKRQQAATIGSIKFTKSQDEYARLMSKATRLNDEIEEKEREHERMLDDISYERSQSKRTSSDKKQGGFKGWKGSQPKALTKDFERGKLEKSIDRTAAEISRLDNAIDSLTAKLQTGESLTNPEIKTIHSQIEKNMKSMNALDQHLQQLKGELDALD